MIKSIILICLLFVILCVIITLVLIFQSREYQTLFVLIASVASSAFFIALLSLFVLSIKPKKNLLNLIYNVKHSKTEEYISTLEKSEEMISYNTFLCRVYIYNEGEKKIQLYVPNLCQDFQIENTKTYRLKVYKGFLVEAKEDEYD